MAIQGIGPGTALIPTSYQSRQVTGGQAAPDAAANLPATTTTTSTDSTTVVSETTNTNADGSVTTVITYKDGHTVTTTSPATVANPSAQLLVGDFRSTNYSIGHLLNILV